MRVLQMQLGKEIFIETLLLSKREDLAVSKQM